MMCMTEDVWPPSALSGVEVEPHRADYCNRKYIDRPLFLQQAAVVIVNSTYRSKIMLNGPRANMQFDFLYVRLVT